jgi:Protein of unknown function (DUF3014)
MHPAERDDKRSDRTIAVLVALAAVLVVSVVAMWLWSTAAERQPPMPAPVAKAPPPREQSPPAEAAASATVQYPVASDDKPLEAHEIPLALGRLLGTKAVTSFLQVDDFPRRFAATVDNLAREHSPSMAWPVLPAPGRFLVEERAEGTVIAAENAARYTPMVLLAGTIDVPAAVRLYRRMYPLLQHAYRELGFGQRYLNDRVIEVIDVLLATPGAPEFPRLELLPVRGPVPSLQPWLRYQFADPELEALSAGQKILVRIGPVNQRRLMSKLVELRKELTGPVLPVAAAAPENPASTGEPAAGPGAGVSPAGAR